MRTTNKRAGRPSAGRSTSRPSGGRSEGPKRAGATRSSGTRGAARGAARTAAPRGGARTGAPRGAARTGAPKRSFAERPAGVRSAAGTRSAAGAKRAYSDRLSGGNKLSGGKRTFKHTKGDFERVRSQIEEREVSAAPMKARAQAYTPKPRQPKVKGEEGVRLNKFIANSGLCSRREADQYIIEGLVSVNGQVVTELGTKVFQNDVVKVEDKVIKGEEKVYILMNKPKNCVTTTDDPQARKTVIDLIAGKCSQRVYPVGRLDRDTTGVLLLTNDGDLTERLTHPSYNKKKIYQVFLDKNLTQKDFEKILKGVHLDDGMINADALSYIDGDHSQVGIEIHSGRNRIVRRIFESLGYKVVKLDRVYFAGLTKKSLRRGQWRFLTDKEVAMLMMGSYE